MAATGWFARWGPPGLKPYPPGPGRWSRDVLAGIAIVTLAVPQSLAVAKLAGVPPYAGLYAAILAMIAYPLVGSSRQIISGPEATTAAMTAAAIAPLAGGDAGKYLLTAGMLALLVGAALLIGGLVRLGFMAELLPRPVLHGYANGVALTLIIGQLPGLLGLKVPDGAGAFQEIETVVTGLGHLSLAPVAIGVGALALAIGLRWIHPRFPSTLVAVVGAMVAVAVLRLDQAGVAVVGEVPSGFPKFALPHLPVRELFKLLAIALGISVVTFSDSALNARAIAQRRGYRIDADRELLGLGLANVAVSFFQGMPVSSSGARSSLAEAMGARSQVASWVGAAGTALVVIFLTAPLRWLPQAALSAVIISAAIGMISAAPLRRLLRVDRLSFVLAVVTMLGVLFVGVLEGIGVAIGLALVDLLRRAARPHDAVLGEVRGVDGFHDIERYDESQTFPGLLAYRFDAPLFFANADHFRREVRELLDQAKPEVRWLVVDAEAMMVIDYTATEMLRELNDSLRARGVTLVFARVKGPIREQLERAGVTDVVGPTHFFPTVTSAVQAFLNGGAPTPA